MKRFQALVAGISGVALLAAFATPSLSKMTVIEEEELDEVTAAGQPKIAQARTIFGDSEAYNYQKNVFATHVNGQNQLTALTLNNIFGENQVANGVNIQAAGSNGGDQLNVHSQSWGSARAHDAVKVEGKEGGPGGDAGTARARGLIAKANGGNGGNGGNATSGKIALLWEFADEIADSASGTGDAYAWNEVYTTVAVALEHGSQTNLTALTVNNIFGFNQVANGTNISGGGINSDTGLIAGGSSASGQANVLDQYRGAPLGYVDAKTFSNKPPVIKPIQ